MKIDKLVLMLLLTLSSIKVNAFEVDGIAYSITSDSETSGYTVAVAPKYYTGEVIIPLSVEYDGISYTVTAIKNLAFNQCSGLTSVKLPNSLTSIGDNAFAYCTSLASIDIPSSVSLIGVCAFYECTKMSTINVAGDNEFYCSDNGVLFDKNKKSLISYPIGKSGSSYSIPNTVSSIEIAAFYGCKSLTSIEIPNSVTTIDGFAFFGCSSLSSTVIPNSVTSIGESAFQNCSKLASVDIGNSVATIGDYAFYGCSSLTSVDIGNSVATIGDYSFFDCSSLTSIEIPNSVISIGSNAFEFCTGLNSIEIGNSVSTIGESAFANCKKLKSVHISDLEAWCKITFSSESSNPLWFAEKLFLNGNLITELVVPSSVTTILNYSFSHCKSLTSIELANSVTSIGYYSFYGCSNLSSIVIPNSVTTIGGHALRYCSNLKSLELPSSITTIGKKVFYGMNLEELRVQWENPECLGDLDNVFNDVDKTTLYVPIGTIENYKNRSPWNRFKDIKENDVDGIKEAKKAILIRSLDNGLQISGTERGEKIAVYSTNGIKLCESTANDGQTTIPCHIQKGETVIISYSGKEIKFRK